MSIFSEIAGLSGENLGSALLKYLLINSIDVRLRFMNYLSDNSPIGPLGSSSYFGCQTEFSTSDETNGNGRIDILIQADDIIIGIENKFYADFMGNQPEKYKKDLDEVAKAMASIYRRKPRYVIYVLCPESRLEEAKSHVTDENYISFITWEGALSILEDAKAHDEISDPVTRSVLVEFIKFLKEYFSFVTDYERKLPHYSSFQDGGSQIQAELVGKLHPLFFDSGPRLSFSKEWIGYYFYNSARINNAGHSGWYGFVRQSLIVTPMLGDQAGKSASFIIASTYKPACINEKIYKEITMKHENFSGNKQRKKNYCWAVDLEKIGTKKSDWQEALSPFQKDPNLLD